MKRLMSVTALTLAMGAAACGGGNAPPQGGITTPGADRATKTGVLETGANLMQSKGPVEKISIYLDGFHAAKDDPNMQMEAHHYCNQVNEDFAQCVLFDGNTADARMMGVEYIVSEKIYNTLPADEKAYWHPHNFEILSGQLRLPGLPDVAEKEALKGKMNSYGKTWHFWMTGMRDPKKKKTHTKPHRRKREVPTDHPHQKNSVLSQWFVKHVARLGRRTCAARIARCLPESGRRSSSTRTAWDSPDARR